MAGLCEGGNVPQFDQTNLGLPTRDYFLQPSNMVYLDAYKNYLIKIATLLGAPLDNATQQAEEIITFEKRLAKVGDYEILNITSAPDERRNVSELYQRMSVGELRQLIPQVDWYRYLTLVLARPVNVSEPVVVFALQYIQDLVTLLEKHNQVSGMSDDDDDEDEEGRRGNPVLARSLLLSNSTKGATRLNIPTNHYQQ
ncbi:hypothetical protein ANN_08319 [Periplaneta americana]|uniref:Peptidase M13 N-terminal domain-containing protein n=1 Tax=Periplaneta americana TaxID=6978 RepID=A0ABQ8T284_PERAM|nr:hypothetical protein ANN_08319 [Periplaneta americana]